MVGSVLTAQSDIYTLGLVLYEMITGERPFGSPPSPTAMLQSMIMNTPPPISTRSDAPIEVDALVTKCIARDPDERWRDVDTLAAEIDLILANAGEPTRTNVAVESVTDEYQIPEMRDTEIGPDKFRITLPGVMMPSPRKR
jgi:serine/threonine protein kinase